jgi:hypothetical protein
LDIDQLAGHYAEILWHHDNQAGIARRGRCVQKADCQIACARVSKQRSGRPSSDSARLKPQTGSGGDIGIKKPEAN